MHSFSLVVVGAGWGCVLQSFSLDGSRFNQNCWWWW